VVNAVVRAEHEQTRIAGANDRLMASSITTMQFSAVVGPFMMLALNFGIAGAIWFGGMQVTPGNMTIGEIVAFTNYLRQLLMSLLMVSLILVPLMAYLTRYIARHSRQGFRDQQALMGC
jgi:ATP-binding cassette subfamily B multidrug efflux pump